MKKLIGLLILSVCWTTVADVDVHPQAIQIILPSQPTTNDLAQGIDEITVELEGPTCADVKVAGLLDVGDVDENCRVNLADFALLAADWLRCSNDPANFRPCFWMFSQ